MPPPAPAEQPRDPAAGVVRPTARAGLGYLPAGVKELINAYSALATEESVSGGVITRLFPAHGRSLAVKEVEWRPSQGPPVPAELRPYVAAWLSSTLPIILTYVDAGKGWVLWTVTAESACLSLHGYPGQLGVYMARRVCRGTELGFLEGMYCGQFREGSAAYCAAVAAAPRPLNGCSYLFLTRSALGLVRLWDGSTDRAGGMRGVNSVAGVPRDANAAIAWQVPLGDFRDDATLHATRTIQPVDASLDMCSWAEREVLYHYGPSFFS